MYRPLPPCSSCFRWAKGGLRLGAGLPVILGVSFAYVPSSWPLPNSTVLRRFWAPQIVGGICAVIVGIMIKKIRKFFPPLIAGTVEFTIGLSLYPTAINYMAGGTGQPNYGSWQNWTVAIFTLVVVTVLNHFAKGFLKPVSILDGHDRRLHISPCSSEWSALPMWASRNVPAAHIMHFGINFEISACVAIGLLFVINSVQAIGDFSATTAGGLTASPPRMSCRGAILGYGIASVIGAFLAAFPPQPTARTVGIVATTKVLTA